MGPTGRYRGARSEGNEKGAVLGLFLAGHPFDGMDMGYWENLLPLADAWIDGQNPPPTPGGERYRRPRQAGDRSRGRTPHPAGPRY